MKRIFVSGGAGFVGSNVCDYLLAKGYDVMAVDNFSTGKLENLADFCKNGGSIVNADIRDHDGMIQLFMKFRPDAVIHLAAQASISTSISNPVQDVSINCIGTLSIIRACQKFNVEKFIFSSTSAVYAETNRPLYESSEIAPMSPYGVSKYASELYIKSMLKNYIIFRFANIYGPRQQPIGTNQLLARAIRHFKYGDDFSIFGDGKQARDYLYVDDVSRAMHMALTDGITGTFNLSSGVSTSVNDVLGIVEEVYDVVGYPWPHSQQKDLRECVRINSHAVKMALDWRPDCSLVTGIRCLKQWWDMQI